MKTILFVCTGNYYRSRFAELYCNARMPAEAGWHADSRGFEPSPLNPGPIARSTLAQLDRLGIAYDAPRQPMQLTTDDLLVAERIIMLDEDEHVAYVKRLFPEWHGRVEYWRVADLHAMTAPEALAAIQQAVDQLIVELAAMPEEIVRAGYDKVSYAYRGDSIEAENPEHQKYAAWLISLLDILPSNTAILDLGCGNGIPTSKLLADAGCRVTGVDISPVQIERARQLVPNAEFICADMSTLHFEPESFGAIVCFYAIIHVPVEEQPGLLAKLYGWLQPGGSLMVIVGGNEAWTGTEQRWLDVPEATMYWSHADLASYRGWLEAQGFRIDWQRFIPEDDSGHYLLLAQKA